MLGSVFSDYTGGYNMISWNLLKKLNISKLNNLGYGFLIVLKFNSSNLSRNISEIPIIFYDRKFGVSKIPLSTIAVTFCLVIKLSLMSRIK
jgi:dolichol-phosphate mannosyltransferase